MFIIVIIIIIKSTRLDSIDYKSTQRGVYVYTGGGRGNTRGKVDRVLQMAKKFVGTQIA